MNGFQLAIHEKGTPKQAVPKKGGCQVVAPNLTRDKFTTGCAASLEEAGWIRPLPGDSQVMTSPDQQKFESADTEIDDEGPRVIL